MRITGKASVTIEIDDEKDCYCGENCGWMSVSGTHCLLYDDETGRENVIRKNNSDNKAVRLLQCWLDFEYYGVNCG